MAAERQTTANVDIGKEERTTSFDLRLDNRLARHRTDVDTMTENGNHALRLRTQHGHITIVDNNTRILKLLLSVTLLHDRCRQYQLQ
jgi:hypothetical protein